MIYCRNEGNEIMKDIKVRDKIEVEIVKITRNLDETLSVEVKNEMFENTTEFIIRKDKVVWESDSGRVTVR